jgi:hypothetical protein
MISLTAERIVKIAESKAETTLGQIRAINALFRAQDESSLWPINGRFNATERGIRNTQKLMLATGETDILVYALALEEEITRIVNNAN